VNLDLNQLLVGLIIVIASNALVQFLRLVKTPKEVNSGQASQIAAIRDELQEKAEQSARHDEILKHLIAAINRLTERIDRLEPMMARPANGRARGG
jgi:hypothetical protein